MGQDKWRPAKRLNWHQMEHLRTLKRTQPDEWSNTKLSQAFGISVPAVVRILKSKFEGSPEMRARQDAKAKEQTQERRVKFLKTLSLANVSKMESAVKKSKERQNK